LARYLPEAKGNRHLALRLYIWNARLCESFYLPIQLAEVAARNAIHKPVERRFRADWYVSAGFEAILPPKLKDELKKVVSDERRGRGSQFTVNHVVAGLSFGFWLNLLTSSYDKHLWANGLRGSFPRLPRSVDRQQLHERLDQLRRFRNKIAHHYAIFDKSPRAELQNAMQILDWICADSHWLAGELAGVVRVLSNKPSARHV